MKTILHILLILLPNYLLASYGKAVLQNIDRRYVSITDLLSQPQIRLLPTNYGKVQLSDTIQTRTLTRNNLREIWLVYTDYSIAPEFNQEKLNGERVRNIEKSLPGISSDTSIQWTLMRITGIESIDTAKMQFHGFVFIYNIDAGPSLGNVLDRNTKWDSIIVVMDVTTSMLPWLQEATRWLEKNYSQRRIDRFVYYNDGDGKSEEYKQPGTTGGVHTERGEDYLTYVKGIKKYLITGLGNKDIPENTIEALLEAQRHAGPGSTIVLLADNYSTPRDTSLIHLLFLPVRVIACGTKDVDIHPALVNIAYRTKGSIHTCFREVQDFGRAKSNASGAYVFKAGSQQYITQGKQLRCITCKNDPSKSEAGSLKRR